MNLSKYVHQFLYSCHVIYSCLNHLDLIIDKPFLIWNLADTHSTFPFLKINLPFFFRFKEVYFLFM